MKKKVVWPRETMTDDEIRYFFADSTNDGGTPRSRQEDGLTHQVQEQLTKQTQVGRNSLEPLSLKPHTCALQLHLMNIKWTS